MHLQEVENSHLGVVEPADLNWMEEVGLRVATHVTGYMLKHVESLVDMARPEFHIGCLGIGITACSIYIVIPLGVLLARSYMISEFDLWTLAPKTEMPLEMMWVTILQAICKPCC